MNETPQDGRRVAIVTGAERITDGPLRQPDGPAANAAAEHEREGARAR